MTNRVKVITEEVFNLVDKGEMPLTSLFQSSREFSQFYTVKENSPQLLNMGLIFLDDLWQKKIVSWLKTFSDDDLKNVYHFAKKHERFIPIYGKTIENVLHLAISYGNIDTTQYFIEKAKSTFPELLTTGYQDNDSLLQMAIMSQNSSVFEYVFNHLEHQYLYLNNKSKNALDYAYLYYPQALEKLHSKYDWNNLVDYFQKRQDFYHNMTHGDEQYNWHDLSNFLKHEATTQAIIEKIQFEKSLSQVKTHQPNQNKI